MMNRRLTVFALATASFAVGLSGSAEERKSPLPVNKKTVPVTALDAPQNLVDDLNQASLQEAFRLLRSEYIKRDDFDYLELNRAALQGLLERLEFGATILTEKDRSSRNSPFKYFATTIDKSTGYIRFGEFNSSEVASLDLSLKKFKKDHGADLQTLVLDLRSPQAQAGFEVAAQILSRFRPPNELLFKIRRPQADRPRLFIAKAGDTSWIKQLIVLVDKETGNVGEIIAGVLKKQDPAVILIGEKTKGLPVEYRDVPLGEDRILRYAIAEVILDDDSSLFQTGITPDIVAIGNRKSKLEIFRRTEAKESELADYLFQKQRPRMNEAALVAGTDPELDYYLARSNGRPTPWDTPPLEDRTLQQAVDLLTTTKFFAPKNETKLKKWEPESKADDKNAEGETDED